MLRPHYRERQVLEATDLDAEQAYRLVAHRRHNIAGHGWGILHGLLVELLEQDPVVSAGFAVDGYGRELILTQPYPVPREDLDRWPSSNEVDLWLLYQRSADTPPQRGRYACGPGRNSRWADQPRVLVLPATADPSVPIWVAEEDLSFGPGDVPPDDPEREWPVFLGTFVRSPASVASRDVAAATARGESIIAPSGAARVRVGFGDAGDRQRFAVAIAPKGIAPIERLTLAVAPDNASLVLRGNTTITGHDLQIDAAALQFPTSAAAPESARPWQVRRAEVKAPPDVQPQPPPRHQLQVEIKHPGEKGDPSAYRLVFGTRGEAPAAFKPLVTVAADGRVTVHGSLTVTGKVLRASIKADPNDPRFTEALLDQWESGLLTAADRLDAVPPALLVTIDNPLISNGVLTYDVGIGQQGVTVSQVYVYVYESLYGAGRRLRQGLLPDAPAVPGTLPVRYILPQGTFNELAIAITVAAVVDTQVLYGSAEEVARSISTNN